jgi:hypothetical protein
LDQKIYNKDKKIEKIRGDEYEDKKANAKNRLKDLR